MLLLLERLVRGGGFGAWVIGTGAEMVSVGREPAPPEDGLPSTDFDLNAGSLSPRLTLLSGQLMFDSLSNLHNPDTSGRRKPLNLGILGIDGFLKLQPPDICGNPGSDGIEGSSKS